MHTTAYIADDMDVLCPHVHHLCQVFCVCVSMHVCTCISKGYFACLCDKIPEKNLKKGGLRSDSQFEGKMYHGRKAWREMDAVLWYSALCLSSSQESSLETGIVHTEGWVFPSEINPCRNCLTEMSRSLLL